jgi:hypothetical protein
VSLRRKESVPVRLQVRAVSREVQNEASQLKSGEKSIALVQKLAAIPAESGMPERPAAIG